MSPPLPAYGSTFRVPAKDDWDTPDEAAAQGSRHQLFNNNQSQEIRR